MWPLLPSATIAGPQEQRPIASGITILHIHGRPTRHLDTRAPTKGNKWLRPYESVLLRMHPPFASDIARQSASLGRVAGSIPHAHQVADNLTAFMLVDSRKMWRLNGGLVEDGAQIGTEVCFLFTPTRLDRSRGRDESTPRMREHYLRVQRRGVERPKTRRDKRTGAKRGGRRRQGLPPRGAHVSLPGRAHFWAAFRTKPCVTRFQAFLSWFFNTSNEDLKTRPKSKSSGIEIRSLTRFTTFTWQQLEPRSPEPRQFGPKYVPASNETRDEDHTRHPAE